MPATDRTAQRQRWVLAAALAAYTVFLALVLGWPTPVDAPVGSTLQDGLRRLHELGVPVWVTYGKVEFAANIALFVPVGVLLALVLRRTQWWLAMLGGFGLSVLAELAQWALRPHRFASPRDVVSNTLGSVVGVLIVLLVARYRDRTGARTAGPLTPEPRRAVTSAE